MAYNENLANRIRKSLALLPNIEEKMMFGGVCFMLNGKMCVGVTKDEMMCRIDPDIYESALSKRGCREMVFTGKPMKGYVFVSEDGMESSSDFDYWIQQCVEFNAKAKASTKKKK
ncbi:MAG: TfoX/Sxy family protein [Ignavibacteria bacterium]|nr:TfoX/Sxy family protein [Ignavibacteria bacterium]